MVQSLRTSAEKTLVAIVALAAVSAFRSACRVGVRLSRPSASAWCAVAWGRPVSLGGGEGRAEAKGTRRATPGSDRGRGELGRPGVFGPDARSARRVERPGATTRDAGSGVSLSRCRRRRRFARKGAGHPREPSGRPRRFPGAGRRGQGMGASCRRSRAFRCRGGHARAFARRWSGSGGGFALRPWATARGSSRATRNFTQRASRVAGAGAAFPRPWWCAAMKSLRSGSSSLPSAGGLGRKGARGRAPRALGCPPRQDL